MNSITTGLPALETELSNRLLHRLENRTAVIGVAGLGYVGLPLLSSIAKAGYHAIGFDIDAIKVELINNGVSYIDAVKSEQLTKHRQAKKIWATSDFSEFSNCDVICMCVPTPLTKQREPDLSFVENTTLAISQNLGHGQLIVLESTTYPGTTDDVVKPILERSGLTSGIHFFIGYSPEREDPGNTSFDTASIPKVVAGDGVIAKHLTDAFYSSIVTKTVPVSSVKTAEVVKITENVFRAVNIGLVNELKVIYDEMGIDIWEVIDAAKTKPFGFMPFYPGPGLGGHCIPVDPFYLTWKSREFELPTRFIELAGEINQAMPRYVIRKLETALDERLGLSLRNASILIVGLAYKKNVADVRESPSLKLMELLDGRVVDLAFHDSYVSKIPATRNHPELSEKRSIDLTPVSVAAYDALIIATDHDNIDFAVIAKHSRLVIDTRNALKSRGFPIECVVRA